MPRSTVAALLMLAFAGGAALAQTNAPTPPAPATGTDTASTPLAGRGAGRAALRQACAADFQALCPGMQPGDGKLGPCLRTNREKLGPACRDALATLRAGRGNRLATPAGTMPPQPVPQSGAPAAPAPQPQ